MNDVSSEALERWAERLIGRLVGLDSVERGAVGRIRSGGRALATIRARPRRRAVRVDLAPGWPWPRRRSFERSAQGWVIWVRDERSLLSTVDVVRRALWRETRRRRRA